MFFAISAIILMAAQMHKKQTAVENLPVDLMV